jgi:hypothetical protein
MEDNQLKNFRQQLMNVVVEHSESNVWNQAKTEWIASFIGKDESGDFCKCGKENIHYLFSITHKVKNIVLEPIGSSCIRHFNEESMTTVVKEFEKQLRDSRKVKKFCSHCNEPHKNRKNNLCNKCRKLHVCKVCRVLSASVYCSFECIQKRREESNKKSLSNYKQMIEEKLNESGKSVLGVGNVYPDKTYHWIVSNDPSYCEGARKFVKNEAYRLLVEYYDAIRDFIERF